MRSPVIIALFLLCSVSLSAQNIDIRILRSVNSSESLSSDGLFRFISGSDYYIAGGIPVIMGVSGLLAGDERLISNSLVVAGACIVNYGITAALKYSVNRDRPFVTYPDITQKFRADSPSFPSGHTSFAFATATSLSLAYREWYVIVPSFLWAGGVAYSSMYLGVHYPSDVLAGALTGAASAYLSFKINQKIQSMTE